MKCLAWVALILTAFAQPCWADEAAILPDKNAVDWLLLVMDGAPVDYSATLNLGKSSQVVGQGPCNRYFADLNRDGVMFKLGAIGATKMACLQMKGEAAFFAALQAVEFADQRPARLTLTGGGHEMVFEQVFD